MDWIRWEVLSMILLAFSVGAYALAWGCSNTEDQVYAKRAMLAFTATSLALAFPLGTLHWPDLIGIAGMVCLWLMARSVDRGDAYALAVISVVLLTLWTWYYNMSEADYAACFSLAVFNSLMVLWLKRSWDRRETVSEMPARHLNPT